MADVREAFLVQKGGKNTLLKLIVCPIELEQLTPKITKKS